MSLLSYQNVTSRRILLFSKGQSLKQLHFRYVMQSLVIYGDYNNIVLLNAKYETYEVVSQKTQIVSKFISFSSVFVTSITLFTFRSSFCVGERKIEYYTYRRIGILFVLSRYMVIGSIMSIVLTQIGYECLWLPWEYDFRIIINQ